MVEREGCSPVYPPKQASKSVSMPEEGIKVYYPRAAAADVTMMAACCSAAVANRGSAR